MKKSISFIIRYIVYFVFFSLLLSFLYTQIVQLRNLIVDSPIKFINFDLFKIGFLITLPYVAIIALVPTLQVTISKRYTFWQYTIPYVLICVSIWLFLVPYSAYLNEKYCTHQLNEANFVTTPLSNGLFRKTDKSIDYYVSTNDDFSSQILRYQLPSRANTSSTLELINEKTSRKSIYADSIVADYFSKLKSPLLVINVFSIISQKANEALNKGFIPYLWFVSLGLAISCMSCVRRFTRWRMLNAFNMLVHCAVVLIISALLYSPSFYDKTKIPLRFMEWLPSIVNLSISAILMIIGLVQVFVKQDPNIESD